jgi:hypothetical protein
MTCATFANLPLIDKQINHLLSNFLDDDILVDDLFAIDFLGNSTDGCDTSLASLRTV